MEDKKNKYILEDFLIWIIAIFTMTLLYMAFYPERIAPLSNNKTIIIIKSTKKDSDISEFKDSTYDDLNTIKKIERPLDWTQVIVIGLRVALIAYFLGVGVKVLQIYSERV